jgi:hypothetical protein
VLAAEGGHDGAVRLRSWLTAALALIGTLALGAAPATAVGWSPAVTVSAPHDAISNLVLASGATADMVSWHFDDLAPAHQIFGPSGASYAVAPVSGPFGAQRQLPTSYASGPLVALGGGGVAQLILHRTGVNTARPSVAIGGVSGRFGRPLSVTGTVWVGRASLAGNRNGELLLAWISSPRTGHRQVWASVRLRGRDFAAPQLISSSANGLAVTASVGPGAHRSAAGRAASDMVVAFDSKRGRMLVRVQPHGRSCWGAVADIGPAAVGNENDVATPYVGRDGRIVVAWYHRQLSEAGEQGPSYTQIAVRPPNRGRFLPAQTLARSRNGPLSGDVALVGGEGHPPLLAFLATASTSEPTPARSIVRVSSGHGDRFSAARTVSLSEQWTTGVAAAMGPGGPIVTWVGGPNPPFSALSPGAAVYAALGAPAGNQFGAAVEVSPAEHVQSAAPLRTENGDRWIIAWSGLPQFLSPQSAGRSVVRVTTCSTGCG